MIIHRITWIWRLCTIFMTVMKGVCFEDVLAIQEVWQRSFNWFLKILLAVSRNFMNVVKTMLFCKVINLKTNKCNLLISFVISVLWYHSPNALDTTHVIIIIIILYSNRLNSKTVTPKENNRVCSELLIFTGKHFLQTVVVELISLFIRLVSLNFYSENMKKNNIVQSKS